MTREEAIKELQLIAKITMWNDRREAVEMAIEALSADRPTGEWIQNDNGTWLCNQCHSWIPDEQHYYARYCLYCGAKMGGESDG